MTDFFNRFPLIDYQGRQSRNLLARTKLRDEIKSYSGIYLPLTLQEFERADIVAYDFYGDPSQSWLIYYANDVVDPYYDWYLNVSDFESMIVEKYGTMAAAQQTAYYQNNSNNEIQITTYTYGKLDTNSQAEWSPVSYYDMEVTNNEQRLNISIINKEVADQIDVELTAKLAE
jgi:hypothetical protein